MSVRTRRAHRHASTHAFAFSVAGFFGFIALFIIAIAFSLSTLVSAWLQDLPDYKAADAYLASEPTTVYDADGNVIATFCLENRKSVSIDQVSPYVLDGTVSIEDVRFYDHNGVDPKGVLRAALSGGTQGGSTITQQVVRNTVLSGERFDRTIKRKVREAYIAIEMERTFSKEQILMMYVNTIYYGHGAYGIEAASITYFNKHAKDLSLAEAAMLSGMPQAPSAYDPTINPDACLKRRNAVLEHMLTAGRITQDQYNEAVKQPLGINLGDAGSNSQKGPYPYFTDYVKSILEKDFGKDKIMQGGLKIYTTIDPKYQKAAEDAINKRMKEIGDSKLLDAMVAIDPATGNIKAMVGGPDYSKTQFNNITQAKRQPGSSFKPIVLAAAIEQGMNPNIIIDCSSPQKITEDWTLKNYDNNNYGNITLAKATYISANTGYVRVAQKVGLNNVINMAHRLGMDVNLPEAPSIAIGTIEVTPLEMAEVYATFASGGIHHDPVAITKIQDRHDNIIYEHQDNGQRVMSEQDAAAVTNILCGVVQQGTLKNLVQLNKTNQPIAGKTGTTNTAGDLWFCGYTPQIAVASWCGYSNNKTIKFGGTTGTSTAQSIQFAYFINEALAGLPRQNFINPGSPEYKPNNTWGNLSRGTGSVTNYLSSPDTQTDTQNTNTQSQQNNNNKNNRSTQQQNEQSTSNQNN